MTATKEESRFRIAEIKELVISTYRRTYDLDLAYEMHKVDDELADILESDTLFTDRLNIIEAQLKETVVTKIVDLLESESESIRLKAATTLGRMMYPERFDNTKESTGARESVNIYLPDNGR